MKRLKRKPFFFYVNFSLRFFKKEISEWIVLISCTSHLLSVIHGVTQRPRIVSSFLRKMETPSFLRLAPFIKAWPLTLSRWEVAKKVKEKNDRFHSWLSMLPAFGTFQYLRPSRTKRADKEQPECCPSVLLKGDTAGTEWRFRLRVSDTRKCRQICRFFKR